MYRSIRLYCTALTLTCYKLILAFVGKNLQKDKFDDSNSQNTKRRLTIPDHQDDHSITQSQCETQFYT